MASSSLLKAFKSVGWAILGVRKSKDRVKDFENLNIIHLMIASAVAVVAFVALLMFVVHLVVPTANS